MPEMTFTVRWPDGIEQEYYSPSLVMHDYLDVDGRYAVADFRDRSTTALREARERVRAKFGFACTSADASVEAVTAAAGRYADSATVTVLRMYPPLPESIEATTAATSESQ